MFIVIGIIMIIAIGVFASVIITSGMKNSLKKYILTGIIAFLIGFGISGLFSLERKGDLYLWNNGKCECGGNWDFVNAEYLRNGGEFYYYECQKCKSCIRTHSHMK